jgi:ABC-2 type transport system ATP-binding protein
MSVITAALHGSERFTRTRDPRAVPVTATDAVPGVDVAGLTKDYGTRRAVDGVTFAVPRGATVGLLGGNGAGKTTTLAMIMGLVTPTDGRVSVLGHDMAEKPQQILHRVNFGSPYIAMPARLTVRQNLWVFGRLYGVPDLRRRVAAIADEFELDEVLDGTVGRLSAGQKTRVALAKALLNDPEVLLLDEPTASLDPDRAYWVRHRLELYRERRGATIVMASHNMPEVERLCDFVVILSRGRVIEIETPSALIRRHGRSGLDEVYVDITRAAEIRER